MALKITNPCHTPMMISTELGQQESGYLVGDTRSCSFRVLAPLFDPVRAGKRSADSTDNRGYGGDEIHVIGLLLMPRSTASSGDAWQCWHGPVRLNYLAFPSLILTFYALLPAL